MVEGATQESWNMATATMQRLHRLLVQSSFYAQTGDLIRWFKVIMDLRRNLYPFFEENEFKEIEKKLKQLPTDWNKYGVVKSADYSKVNQIFDDIYMKYMQVMKARGLLLPRARDASRAVIGG